MDAHKPVLEFLGPTVFPVFKPGPTTPSFQTKTHDPPIFTPKPTTPSVLKADLRPRHQLIFRHSRERKYKLFQTPT